jgi:hypothetical protein
MPFIAIDPAVLMHHKFAFGLYVSGTIEGVHRGFAFGHEPKLCSLIMTLHAEMLSRLHCEFFEFGTCANFM